MSAMKQVWPFRRISRQPSFFGEGRVADTLDGRLEVVILHASLALVRLKREAALEPLAQAFTDVLFRNFDAGLREAGVGDLIVPKRMRKIAGAFYGRLDAYAANLAADRRSELEAALARNALSPEAASFAPVLADYAAATAALQAERSHEDLFRLDGWAPAPA
jgi:cytochrome b pre-mRNA-processing protein 3